MNLDSKIATYYKEYKYAKRVRPIIKAMRKYGFDNFVFEIVKNDIKTKEKLDELEKYYIQLYQSLIEQNGYNIELGGNSVGKHADTTKRKISEAQIGDKNHMFNKTGKLNKTSKPVIELTTGKIYESANLAAQDLHLSFSHVCSVARGERASTGGFVFRYIDDKGVPIRPNKVAHIKYKTVRDLIKTEYSYLI